LRPPAARIDHSGVPTAVSWLAFLAASLLFIQVPGPSLLFTIGRALTVGRRDALLSVVGNGVGLLCQMLAVAFGLGALVSASATAYTVLRLAGAAYVLYLGVQAIRHRADARLTMLSADRIGHPQASAQRSLRVGVTVGLTNPKTLVFFTAFLPQFVNTDAGHAPVQLLALGAAFAVMAVASDSVWALLAARARDWFGARPQRLDTLSATGGSMMIALGLTLAVRD
jgi:threonine/homoserine/homoserine lactone efflux protein